MSQGETIPDQEGYSVRIIKDHIFGLYHGRVLLDGKDIGRVPVLGGACSARESVVEHARKFAITHRENNAPAITLDLPSGDTVESDQ